MGDLEPHVPLGRSSYIFLGVGHTLELELDDFGILYLSAPLDKVALQIFLCHLSREPTSLEDSTCRPPWDGSTCHMMIYLHMDEITLNTFLWHVYLVLHHYIYLKIMHTCHMEALLTHSTSHFME
jgi:hypothetical protein